MAISQDDFQLYFLLVLIGTFALLSFAVFYPYLFYIIGGIILVYINYPLYGRIKRFLGNESLAAALSIVVLILLTVIPTFFLVSSTVAEGQQLIEQIGEELPEHINVAFVEAYVQQLTGQEIDLREMIEQLANDVGDFFSASLPGLIKTVADAVIGTMIMGFTMYYLFKDGRELVDSVMHVVPLEERYKHDLLREVDNMAEGILIGHLLTSTVQGIIAGIGLWITGIPNVIFWTFTMILLGLVPVIGNVLVWAPAGIYLIITGDTLAGIGLLLYGTIVVGMTDNIVRAKFVESRANIHPLLVLIGAIGGIPLFGLLGVVLGPLVLGVFVALLRFYTQDFWQQTRGNAATP